MRSCRRRSSDVAQPRQVGQQLGADGVHHVLGVALEHRHEGLHAVEHHAAVGADHDRGEAALAHGVEQAAQVAEPRDAAEQAAGVDVERRGQLPHEARRDAGAATARRRTGARGSSRAAPPSGAARRGRRPACAPRGRGSARRRAAGRARPGRGWGTRTARARGRPGSRRPRRPPGRARRRPPRPTGPDSAPIRPVTLSAAGSSTPRRLSRFAWIHSGRSTASGAGSAPDRAAARCRRRRGARSPPRARPSARNGAGSPEGCSAATPSATLPASCQSTITSRMAGADRRPAPTTAGQARPPRPARRQRLGTRASRRRLSGVRAATTGECGARSSGAASGSSKAVNATCPPASRTIELRGGGVHRAAAAQRHHAVEARGGDLAERHGDRADRPHAVGDVGERVGRQPHPARVGRLEAEHLELAVHRGARRHVGIERRAVEQRALAAPGDPLLPAARSRARSRTTTSAIVAPSATAMESAWWGRPRLAFLEPSIGSTTTSGLPASRAEVDRAALLAERGEARALARGGARAGGRPRPRRPRRSRASGRRPRRCVPVSRARSAVVGSRREDVLAARPRRPARHPASRVRRRSPAVSYEGARDGPAPAQRAAVTHPGGPLLVIGGAGTGKTHVLVERFVWLRDQGTPPESVLVLTFSAARRPTSCARRVEARVPPPYEEIAVTTFHGFCAQLLREEARRGRASTRSRRPSRPPTGWRCCWSASTSCRSRSHDLRGNPSALLGSLVQRIDRLKDELVTAGDYAAWAAHAARGRPRRERARATPRARVRRDLRRPRPHARRGRRARLRRPRAARVPPAAREAARARAARAPATPRARRRAAGHELRAHAAAAPARRRAGRTSPRRPTTTRRSRASAARRRRTSPTSARTGPRVDRRAAARSRSAARSGC